MYLAEWKDRDIRVMHQKTVNSHNKIEGQAKIERIREEKALDVWEMKEQGRELHIFCCVMKEIQYYGLDQECGNSRGLRKGVGTGICPLCEVEENQSHILLK